MLTPRNEANDMEKVDEEEEAVGQAHDEMGLVHAED